MAATSPARWGQITPAVQPGHGLDLAQGLLQVVLQVAGVLDADAEPDQAVVDAAGDPNFGGDAGMRHGRRMADQRLDAAQALGQAEESGARQELLGCGARPLAAGC